MTVELIGQLNSDLHPMYIYLTFYIALICSYGLLYVTHYEITRHHKVIKNNYHAVYLRRQEAIFHLSQWQDIRNWITIKMKRKESPDDDEDNHSSMFHLYLRTLLGGKTCTYNLYSLILKNIGSLV
ncbi:hypothetical protein BN1058_02717 [Paraliobacillus sp. PM-2]|uniref:hypothetical protein n=1 Tax=Paraliobacillus sp. PM-2 TaxID=1462524 RepID=UPI00061C6A12|nr:hypothetical protein [Paraliobacillus sp. PM-2]CQR48349.1 hypothetical protein BN1058_02717 [Paraliobacillus sp. PM-2]